MQYSHTGKDGYSFNLPAGKILSAGRHYGEHAQELNNPAPAGIHRLDIGDEIEIKLTGQLSIRSVPAAHYMR
jgi:hypothetical protein